MAEKRNIHTSIIYTVYRRITRARPSRDQAGDWDAVQDVHWISVETFADIETGISYLVGHHARDWVLMDHAHLCLELRVVTGLDGDARSTAHEDE